MNKIYNVNNVNNIKIVFPQIPPGHRDKESIQDYSGRTN